MNIPFNIIDWTTITATEHRGETGIAYWKTVQFGDLRVRMVEYSPNYKADHWCEKGHLLFVIEGFMQTELKDGATFDMKTNTSYHVSDELSSHRSFTKDGAKLIIIDGGFLKLKT